MKPATSLLRDSRQRFWLLSVAILLAATLAFVAYSQRDAVPRVHDPSTIVRCQNEYWLFSTGPGVLSRHSSDLVTWTAGPHVFQDIPKWITEVSAKQKGYFWAPDVLLLNGRYFLYYSVSEWGVRTSAIALATNATLDPAAPDYHWSDQGIVLRSSQKDDFNAIDPSVMLNADGRLWMAFGSFWSGIKLVELDSVTGLRKAGGATHALAWAKEIEAPCLIAHDGKYYLFVNWGRCCLGVKSTYEIRVGRSNNVTGPYLDQEGVDMMKGGGSLFLGKEGRFIGPGHAGLLRDAGHEWISYHFYDGEKGGAARLGLRKLHWSPDDWPVLGETAAQPP